MAYILVHIEGVDIACHLNYRMCHLDGCSSFPNNLKEGGFHPDFQINPDEIQMNPDVGQEMMRGANPDESR